MNKRGGRKGGKKKKKAIQSKYLHSITYYAFLNDVQDRMLRFSVTAYLRSNAFKLLNWAKTISLALCVDFLMLDKHLF